MDKELILRCALAAMKEVATSGQMGAASEEELAAIDERSEEDKELTVSLFSTFVKHFDAERGKNATAWISDGFTTTERSKAKQWLRNGYEVSPLFRSAPTIPEGWALVKIELTPKTERLGAHVLSEWLDDAAPLHERMYIEPAKAAWKRLLAVQGERNAD